MVCEQLGAKSTEHNENATDAKLNPWGVCFFVLSSRVGTSRCHRSWRRSLSHYWRRGQAQWRDPPTPTPVSMAAVPSSGPTGCEAGLFLDSELRSRLRTANEATVPGLPSGGQGVCAGEHPRWGQEARLTPCWAKFSRAAQDKLTLWASVSTSKLTLQGCCEGRGSGVA